MALRLIKPGPVVVSGTKGSYSVAGGSAPPGWTVWGSDGRIIPPPGLYRVTTTGITMRKRTTDGNFVAVGDLVRINEGEAIAPDYRNGEDVVMVEKVIPPPYFVEFFRRLVGGCRGAKTRATRPRRVPSAGRQPHRRYTRDVDSVAIGAYLPAGGHLLGGDNGWGDRGKARQRDDEGHLPTGGDPHQGRPPAAAIHAGRASDPRHARVAPAGGEGRGA